MPELNPGDEVWVRAVVTTVKADRVGVGVRLASRVGSTYPGSSPKFTRVIDGVVRRVAEVPTADVRAPDA